MCTFIFPAKILLTLILFHFVYFVQKNELFSEASSHDRINMIKFRLEHDQKIFTRDSNNWTWPKNLQQWTLTIEREQKKIFFFLSCSSCLCSSLWIFHSCSPNFGHINSVMWVFLLFLYFHYILKQMCLTIFRDVQIFENIIWYNILWVIFISISVNGLVTLNHLLPSWTALTNWPGLCLINHLSGLNIMAAILNKEQ